jgi:threonine aldolase
MTEPVIDLRSDTVTLPCAAMKQAMAAAELGDDVYGGDPTVEILQHRMAEMTGLEAGLFFPSGTQSNLVALLSHCLRGDEYIAAQSAHTYKFEGGGAAALGGIQPQPIERLPDGTLDLDKVESVIKADDIHFAKTRLLALENTTTEGKAIAVEYITQAAALCRSYNLKLHLDGARVFNAAVELGLDVSEITRHFDSVSICLSKGLGAPVGSVLCGSRDIIKQAIRWRKTVGGGMRQSGMLAAAGIFALENNVNRLKEDHTLANYLAEQLSQFGDIDLVHGQANTNILFFNLNSCRYNEFLEYGNRVGVLFGGRRPARMVTHKDVSREQIDIAIDRLAAFFN